MYVDYTFASVINVHFVDSIGLIVLWHNVLDLAVMWYDYSKSI